MFHFIFSFFRTGGLLLLFGLSRLCGSSGVQALWSAGCPVRGLVAQLGEGCRQSVQQLQHRLRLHGPRRACCRPHHFGHCRHRHSWLPHSHLPELLRLLSGGVGCGESSMIIPSFSAPGSVCHNLITGKHEQTKAIFRRYTCILYLLYMPHIHPNSPKPFTMPYTI